MPMTRAENQTAISPRLYFFESPIAGRHDCLIFGHSGHLYGDGDYTLPPGISMKFYVPPGQPRLANPLLAIRDLAGDFLRGDLTAAGGTAVPNYTVMKAIGTGWPDSETSYRDLQQAMLDNAADVIGGSKNWCPHFVSVRRRKYHGSTNLQEIVETVLHHRPNITTFYWGGCRGVYDAAESVERRARIRAYNRGG